MGEVWVFVVACSIITVVSPQSTPYPVYSWSCNGDPDEPCEYDNKTPRASPDCRGITLKQFDKTDKDWILGAHNGMRNLVANDTLEDAPQGFPPATNMRQITWSNDLQVCARVWALQCKEGLDEPCRTARLFKSSEVKQIAYGPFHSRTRPNWKNAFSRIFWNSMRAADPGHVVSYKGKSYEFFLMMWHSVRKIGCAVVDYHVTVKGKCKKRNRHNRCIQYYPDTRENGIKLVCNYAPAIMKGGAKVWEPGKPCTNCPNNTDVKAGSIQNSICRRNSTYRYLCALPGDPFNEKPVFLPPPPQPDSAPKKSRVGLAFLFVLHLMLFSLAAED